LQDGKNPMFVQFQSSPQILSKLGVMELMVVTVSAWKRRSSSERNALSRSCNAHSGFVIDVWHASHRKCAAASEREIEAWKKARGAAVAAAYEQLLQIAAADLAAAEHAADSECGRACVESHVSQVLRHSLYRRYWLRNRAAARAQLQQLRQEHNTRLRDKEEAERLLAQVSSGVRTGADAKDLAENKRALSARARERDAAHQQRERCVRPAYGASNCTRAVNTFPATGSRRFTRRRQRRCCRA